VLISSKRIGTGRSAERRGQAFTVKSGETSQFRVVDELCKAPMFIDLQPKANHKLKDSLRGRFEGNDFAELKLGAQTLPNFAAQGDDPTFDIGQGLIWLANKDVKEKLPEKVEGINVDSTCSKLNILHATAHSAVDDTVIAKYIVHYEDKSTERPSKWSTARTCATGGTTTVTGNRPAAK
jgi:hypothetical protein